MLDKKVIENNLSVPAEITIYNVTDSTNTRLKEEARNSPLENRVIIAENQTGGRGRLGRQFHSPSESGIYMSLLISPDKFENIGLLTAFTAVAVCDALEKVSRDKFEIKWVNDILKNKKKICGILAEAGAEAGELKYIIVGIGINVYAPQDGFPDDIKNIAGSIFDFSNPCNSTMDTDCTKNKILNKSIENPQYSYSDGEKTSKDIRNTIISQIINNFYSYNPEFVSEYKKRSVVIGKEISVHQSGNVRHAKAVDIDNNCRLLVEYENGDREFLSFGEISIRLD